MNDPVDEFLRRHGLPASLRPELVALARTHHPGSATVAFDDADEEPSSVPLAGRYVDLGVLGVGGSGVVHRVRDPSLDRTLAMKLANEGLPPAAAARFLREARLTASLDHPGVVPVHEVGWTEEGLPYFTMREVHGETLSSRISAVHAASGPGGWGEADGQWSLHRLLDCVRRVCEAVAWAHHRGIVHRDVKPDNVMVGETGEVLLLDWGIARRLDEPRTGVAGTPAYMAPEQARGDEHTPKTDVFALGATLFEVLYGLPPRRGHTVEAVLDSAVHRPITFDPPPRGLPEELVVLAQAAMAPDPTERPDASEVAQRIRRWQEGAARRERAAEMVAEASTHLPVAAERERRIAVLRDEIAALEGRTHLWDPVARKRPLWELQVALEQLLLEQDLDDVRTTELLRAALTQDPDSPTARAALADRYQRAHAFAEQQGDRAAAVRAEVLLRGHDDGRWAGWLRGTAELQLATDPPGAVVTAHRVELRDRRLVDGDAVPLGLTPLTAHLDHGSWRLRIDHPDRAPVVVPVWLERAGRWPRGPEVPLRLPDRAELGPDDVFVAGGPFLAGGDPRAGADRARWVALGPFVVRRHPVTNREYLAYLDDLVRQGLTEEAAAREPRLAGDPAPPVVRTPEGYQLAPDAQGDVWRPDWPVLAISVRDAEAFAAWEAARTGRRWRLGTPDEWEKAARGVDGRRFPWGDHGEPTWSANRNAREGRPLPRAVTDTPEDEGPYGVLGMAGNAATCTRDATGRTWAQGGAWSYTSEAGRCALRVEVAEERRTAHVGVRLFRSG